MVFFYLIFGATYTTLSASTSQTTFPEIKLYVSKNQFSKLQTTETSKSALANPILIINNDTAKVKEIHARGNNSLMFKRKSLSVELDKSMNIVSHKVKFHLKKFNLLNLSMDKHLWHNRWSNIHLDSLGLFPLFNTYCKVWINDEPQGIYLLVEKPQQIRNKINSPYMLRRGPEHTISDEYFDNEDKDAAKKYHKQFLSIYSSIKALNGSELYKDLDNKMNLDAYYQFIAFNYLVMNGDYADEVFFYINPENGKFEIIPWDYDDILRPVPHEGRIARNLEFADKKIFSMEETLDRAIAGNAVLYSQYEATLKKVLLSLDSASLTRSALDVISELKEISSDTSSANATLFLDKEPFDFNNAKNDILLSLDLLLKRRKWILEDLK